MRAEHHPGLRRSRTRARLTAATTVKIAPPPSRAVGFLCQRSLLGCSTTPRRRARARTTGVSTSVPANERTTGKRSMGFIKMSYRAERSGANALLFAKGSGIQRPKRPYESAVAGEMADGTSLGIVRLSAMCHVPFAMPSSGVGRDELRPGLGMGTGTGPLPVIGDDVLESLLQDVGGR